MGLKILHDYDTNPNNKHGFDKMEMMFRFIQYFEGIKNKSGKDEIELLRVYFQFILHRPLTIQEKINLNQGVVDFFSANENSKERVEAARYLINCDFLQTRAVRCNDN